MGSCRPFQVWVILAMVGLCLPTHAGEVTPGQKAPSANSALSAESGPQALRDRTRVTVETNVPPVETSTNQAAVKEKSFEWTASWKGWDGLHLELARKTLLGQVLPGVTNVEQPVLPEALRTSSLTGGPAERGNAPWLCLEETKLVANIGGKFALDGAAYVAGQEFQDFDGGAELRRARLYAKGDCVLILPVSYHIEIGYIPDEFYIEESYLLFRNLPWVGDLKGGQYQAPMGLDVITSSRDITFMEPAGPIQALAPGVNAGIQVGRPVLDQRATWTFGLFTDGVGTDFGEATKDYGRAILRLTGLPIYQADPERPEAARLLHLGLSANLLYAASSAVRYRSRPESHLAPYVIDTGDISAEGALVAGAEAAWVNGPFSVQAEYLHSWVQEDTGQVPNFMGGYVSASWFLTGESRPYDRIEGKFGRVIPKRSFDFGRGGWGAWEVAARYSFVDLNDADVQGGRLSMLMVGVNWYLHSHVKWRFDYGFGRVSGYQPEGNIRVFQTRVEVDF